MTNNQTIGSCPAHLSGAKRVLSIVQFQKRWRGAAAQQWGAAANLTRAKLVWSTSAIGGSEFGSIRERYTTNKLHGCLSNSSISKLIGRVPSSIPTINSGAFALRTRTIHFKRLSHRNGHQPANS